ncbi:hypothetical protein, partial [Aromatoleum sp.]|uniref:hypothetical protein n=1 Tax=Aromatoleum sp. TaxID=2307007 RepID=UPI002FC6BAA4
MPLHPQVEGLLTQMGSSGLKKIQDMTPEESRPTFSAVFAAATADGAGPAVNMLNPGAEYLNPRISSREPARNPPRASTSTKPM